ncbi:hypothetical protein NC651_035020 [Populus alba x Populus x berolinensis]|nr:hypothetical protein NC651_035020 [Populus alba x Populus x berolinensis]
MKSPSECDVNNREKLIMICWILSNFHCIYLDIRHRSSGDYRNI